LRFRFSAREKSRKDISAGAISARTLRFHTNHAQRHRETSMKRAKRKARKHTGGGAIQFFTCGPWHFNVTKALALAGNRTKYQPAMRRPTPQWIGPFIDIDPGYVERSDTSQPVIFATIIQQGQSWPLLIDGNHRVVKAMRHSMDVPVITLDLEDTLKVLTAAGDMVRRMRQEGVRLGLIQSQP
jgi:hypothetical protein